MLPSWTEGNPVRHCTKKISDERVFQLNVSYHPQYQKYKIVNKVYVPGASL